MRSAFAACTVLALLATGCLSGCATTGPTVATAPSPQTAAAFDQNQRRRLVRLAQDMPETVRADSRGAVLEGDPMKDQDLANLRILDAISHDAALEAAEHSAISPKLHADVNAIGDVVRARIAEQRRRDLASAALPLAAAVARPSILAMTRDALVARLAELRAMHPNVILAHRDFNQRILFCLLTARPFER